MLINKIVKNPTWVHSHFRAITIVTLTSLALLLFPSYLLADDVVANLNN